MPDTRLAEYYRKLAREEQQKARVSRIEQFAAQHAVRAAQYRRLAAIAEDYSGSPGGLLTSVSMLLFPVSLCAFSRAILSTSMHWHNPRPSRRVRDQTRWLPVHLPAGARSRARWLAFSADQGNPARAGRSNAQPCCGPASLVAAVLLLILD